ncbi:gamma-glutamyltransferase family protein [Acetobacter estunensis]|uniref:gamma-glutamyltransferase family protein n=1 Tax=Acetobacter estunensis TaxID=104097 RepID=UPI001C2CDFD5|nr:gamma-glutamyltransferase family protein [Acetobacter estunensis]MBV1837861.1 gamma-glutamyltransferase family protein [Acetobacter estunensis]
MLHTFRSLRGMVTSPHHLASLAGLDILKDGGTAIEATVGMAAALSAVYPHMTGLGGDAFWLISWPDGRTQVIDACGVAAQGATRELYLLQGLTDIPWRGGLAANSMAGTVSGWKLALEQSARLQPNLSLERLLRDAEHYASSGYAVSESEGSLLNEKLEELSDDAAFLKAYSDENRQVAAGDIRYNPALGQTLRKLARNGLESFYTGDVSRVLAADLERAGSPLRPEDFSRHRALLCRPLHTAIRGAHLYNTPPPTQGVASLAILKLFDHLRADEVDGYEHVHGLVEATKKAFIFRNRHVGDPAWMTQSAQNFLDNSAEISRLVAGIDMHRAMPWNARSQMGDTTWMGAIDSSGMAVSMIQSLYFEFGSGVFLPETGIVWQNRGSSFRLEEGGWNALEPGRRPFHTLNPALARFSDGRTMVYGTMGGEGQPQTQATIFTRYARYGVPLQQAVTAPRWLLGRTWGEESSSLKMEEGFNPVVLERLREAGHDVEIVPAFSSMMGHAGALVRHPDGLIEGASDPRSDGVASGF